MGHVQASCGWLRKKLVRAQGGCELGCRELLDDEKLGRQATISCITRGLDSRRTLRGLEVELAVESETWVAHT